MRKKNLCIVAPAEGLYSETFIQNHIQYLDFEKTIVYGTSITDFKVNGSLLFPQKWYNRIHQKAYTLFWGAEKDFFFKKRFRQLLKKKKIDVVLAEYGPTGSIITDTCYELKIPVAVHFHGYDASVYSVISENNATYKNMFVKASAIIAVSSAMVKRLINMGADENKIYFNPYGVDINLFQPAAEHQKNIFLSVGRFVDKKAPHLTVFSFYKAWQHNPSIKLKMIGDGPLLNACKELVTALHMEDAVEFLGVKPPAEIAGLMLNACAFIQHSVTAPDGNAEGTPLAILEAGASGLPVISTRHEGIADVIENGVNGMLSDEFDINNMADNILFLASNKNLGLQLGKNARERVSQKYNLKQHISNLDGILNKISSL